MKFFRESSIMRFVTVLALASLMFVTTAPKAYSAETCEDARQAASSKTSSVLWFGAGCLLNGLGVLGAYVIKPDPPMTSIVGKDAMYVAKYTDCYQDEASSIQTKWAWIGCGASVAVYVLYIVAVVGVVSSSM
ncbi:MAG: hypothetical protein FGM33_09560 [Candidatus Kapabacteria bacterium]|nr:hypothetical protein [Candidatus Kapabacteria bacterium]